MRLGRDRNGWLALAAVLLLWLWPLRAAGAELGVYVFWQEGCPYCTASRAVLSEMVAGSADLRLEEIELGPSEAGNALFRAVVGHFDIRSPAVPLVVIGPRYALGFAGDGRSAAGYARMIEACRGAPCRDVVAELRAGATAPAPGPAVAPAPFRVALPWVGEVDLRALSLPVLTVLLAGIDGFNPCAMWVLALLIGLLLGVADSRRMWTLGGVFLLATGAMYFAVMAAWLNVVLWIGAVGWLRLAIGALAIGAGAYHLREYRTNPEGVCRVTPGRRRGRIADAFRGLVEEPSLWLAALGVAALAVAVNLVELVCSAGVPAVYTQLLAMQDLPAAGHYAYLALYLSVFLLDDAALFIIAMLTLRAAIATGRYARLSHLLGGIVLLALGAVMVLRPDLLAPGAMVID